MVPPTIDDIIKDHKYLIKSYQITKDETGRYSIFVYYRFTTDGVYGDQVGQQFDDITYKQVVDVMAKSYEDDRIQRKLGIDKNIGRS